MQTNSSAKSAILALILVLTVIGSWELYLRHKGIKPDYDDDAELWADKRAMVYEPSDKATVFIGSSRIKYDLDIPTWESITRTHAIQLAMVGSSPRLLFDDLANDPNFKGKLIVDVTEVLFFTYEPFVMKSPEEGINFYKKRTPAQKASFALDAMLESKLAFLNQDYFSLNALLDQLHVPDRPKVYAGLDFPLDFETTGFNRQTKMTDKFVADTNLQNQVKGIWAMLPKILTKPPLRGKDLEDDIQLVKNDVDKIRARGGDVIFVRTPSNPPFFTGENMAYPRNMGWDKILSVTQCKGIYFADYPELDHFKCPELSHLKPQDAVLYTKGIIHILETEKGWKF
jgi:hypothetical protein